MKHLLTLVLPLMLLVSSCEKTEYISNGKTIFTYLDSNDWRTIDGGRTYYAEISMPEITRDFNQYGGVLVYISFDEGRTYDAVPNTFNGDTYSFTTQERVLSLFKQYGSGNTLTELPKFMDVKIVLLDSY